MLDRLESEILADRVSEESRRWLASCGLTVEQMKNQMDPVYTPARKIHLYHCDHRGLPLALISTEGATAWCAEYDEWGNLLSGFAPIFPDTCYHLTHYWPAAADIPVASDNPVHYADAIRYNARTPLQGSLLPLTRLV